MPKLKTHSGAKKRFKLSKNGKVIRGHANKSHHSESRRPPSARATCARAPYADKTNVAAHEACCCPTNKSGPLNGTNIGTRMYMIRR